MLVLTVAIGEQLLEQCSVGDHGLSKFVGRGLTAGRFRVDDMRGAVVLYDVRMVDRDQFRLSLEVVDRVAALPHHLCDKLVGVDDGDDWTIDEPALQLLPLGGIPLPSGIAKWANVELVTAIGTVGKITFALATASRRLDAAVVLGTEPVAQRASPHASPRGPERDTGYDDHDCSGDKNPNPSIHVYQPPRHFLLTPAYPPRAVVETWTQMREAAYCVTRNLRSSSVVWGK